MLGRDHKHIALKNDWSENEGDKVQEVWPTAAEHDAGCGAFSNPLCLPAFDALEASETNKARLLSAWEPWWSNASSPLYVEKDPDLGSIFYKLRLFPPGAGRMATAGVVFVMRRAPPSPAHPSVLPCPGPLSAKNGIGHIIHEWRTPSDSHHTTPNPRYDRPLPVARRLQAHLRDRGGVRRPVGFLVGLSAAAAAPPGRPRMGAPPAPPPFALVQTACNRC